MKSSILVFTVAVISIAAGFSGGFLFTSIDHNFSGTSVPVISSFNLSSSTIENGSFAFDFFYFNASALGAANFQVVLENGSGSFTLASGSFYGSINYTDMSLGSDIVLGSLAVGTYNIVLEIFSGSSLSTNQTTLTVIPSVSATISGPQSVNDSSSPQKVTFYSHIKDGRGPYAYHWNVDYSPYYFGDIQNYTSGSNTSGTFQVVFFTNPIYWYSSGYNATYVVTLNVVDALGLSTSVEFTINVTD